MNRRFAIIVTSLAAVAATGVYFFQDHPAPADQSVGAGWRQPQASSRLAEARAEGSSSGAGAASSPALRQVGGEDDADVAFLDGLVMSERFDELLAKAQSSPQFAFRLGQALHYCSTADQMYATVERRLTSQSPKQVAKTVATLDAKTAKCKGLTPGQLSARFDVLDTAARAGILRAQTSYRHYALSAIRDGTAIRSPHMVDRLRQNSEQFALAAARSGTPQGAYAAYELYANGDLIPQDFVRAYEYAAAYARAPWKRFRFSAGLICAAHDRGAAQAGQGARQIDGSVSTRRLLRAEPVSGYRQLLLRGGAYFP